MIVKIVIYRAGYGVAFPVGVVNVFIKVGNRAINISPNIKILTKSIVVFTSL